MHVRNLDSHIGCDVPEGPAECASLPEPALGQWAVMRREGSAGNESDSRSSAHLYKVRF